MLHGDDSIPVTYMAFDVLALDGEPTLRLPYAERRALLEEIMIDGPPSVVEVIGAFEDGSALWDAVVERGLEGVVAKREREPYRPGARLWVMWMPTLSVLRTRLSHEPGVSSRALTRR
jgi:bifunctional non-homologous end joining protein LigD